MYAIVELESSPEMQDLIFENYLVDPSGLHFECGDLFQEQIQDKFYEKLDKYDGEFDAPHVSQVIAPNVYRTMQTKKNMNTSIGLAKRSGKH